MREEYICEYIPIYILLSFLIPVDMLQHYYESCAHKHNVLHYLLSILSFHVL